MVDEGFAIWITGIPACGKSTIARVLAEGLKERGVNVEVLESDELRRILTPMPSYVEEERDHFYESLVFIGKLLTKNGVNIILDATASKRKYRERAREEIKDFLEVYVKCPLNIAMQRDKKGLYAKALKGEIKTLPGLQALYEEPINPEVVVESDKQTPEQCSEKIIATAQKILKLRYRPK